MNSTDLITEYPQEDQSIVRRTLDRYTEEAEQESYRTEPQALVELIRDQDLFRNSEEIFDLGAGNGQLVTEFALLYPDKTVRGIDLCPGFVRNFNRKNTLPNARMDVGLIDRPLPDVPDNDASAISVLTLDRLTNPKVLIANMARFTRAKFLATLIPIVPEDDNPSRQDGKKIVYTREQNRIVRGKNRNEDRRDLQKLLEYEWGQPINSTEVDYVVISSGDRQAYTLGVFFTP